MSLAHGIVPVGWATLLWDAEARDGARLWHHPCAREGAGGKPDLESPSSCKQEHNLHTSLFFTCTVIGGELQCIKAVY